MSIGTSSELRVEGPPEPPPRARLWINRNFLLLASGQAISNMGDFVYSTTLLVWVFELTHSAAAVSGVLIAQYIPIFALGPVAGVFVDRWDRRRTMLFSDIARSVIALLPILAPLFLRLPTIYISVFLISALGRFFMPAKSGLLQGIVSEQEQPKAASISQATFALAIIVGPGLGSPLYFAVGPVISCLVNSVSYLVSAVSVGAIRAPREVLQPSLTLEKQGQGFKAVLGELGTGFSFVAKTRVLLIVSILAFMAMFGAGALNALDIVFVSQQLHVSTALFGPLMAAGGLGALIGAIVSGLLAQKVQARYLLSGGVLLTGLGLVVYALQSWYPAAVAVNFLLCLPQGAIEVGFGPLLISTTPRTLMGRVEAVIQTGMFAASLISIGLAGVLSQFLSVQILFASGGVLMALAGLFGWFSIPASTPTQLGNIELDRTT